MRRATTALFLCSLAQAAEIAPFEFDVHLHDHSRLIGSVEGKKLTVKTQFGDHGIPFASLKRIEFDQDKMHFLFLLRNDDRLLGHPTGVSVKLHSSIGELTIPYAQVRAINITPSTTNAPIALNEGLVVHFTFDQIKGAELPNLSKATPSARIVDAKPQEGALALDGHQDHVVLANHKEFEELEQLTLSIWTKLHSFAPGGYANEHGYLVNKGNDMWWNPAWSLGYHKNSGANKGVHAGPNPALFTVGSEQKGGRHACRVATKTELKADTWYHLVGSYDGKVARLYLDGRLEAEKAYTGKLRRDEAPLLLGGGKLGGTEFGNNFTTDATIDNFRLYKRALSDGEVRLLHKVETRK